ncbi:MAG: hypothetical protein IJH92_08405 [Mogibacterium sp.]|nr:hypothetical protein [Mogibacterium sp.]
MSPEDAYDLLEAIATISGSQKRLKKVKKAHSAEQKVKRPAINFAKCGIPIGAELVYIDDPSVKAIVKTDRKVLYNDELTSLSAIVSALKGIKAIHGPRFFTYNGRPLLEIANETQWRNYQ